MTLVRAALRFSHSLILVPEHGSSVPLQHHLVTTAVNQEVFLSHESLLDVVFSLTAMPRFSSRWCLSPASFLVKDDRGGWGEIRAHAHTRNTRIQNARISASLLPQLL